MLNEKKSWYDFPLIIVPLTQTATLKMMSRRECERKPKPQHSQHTIQLDVLQWIAYKFPKRKGKNFKIRRFHMKNWMFQYHVACGCDGCEKLFVDYHVSTKFYFPRLTSKILSRYTMVPSEKGWKVQHIDHNLFRNGQLHLQLVSKHFEIDAGPDLPSCMNWSMLSFQCVGMKRLWLWKDEMVYEVSDGALQVLNNSYSLSVVRGKREGF